MNDSQHFIRQKWSGERSAGLRLRSKKDFKTYMTAVIVLLLGVLLPETASANMIIGWFAMGLPMGLVLFMLEAVIFWLINKFFFKQSVHVFSIVGVVLLANVVTFLLGFGIVYLNPAVNGSSIVLVFALTVFFEWIIYLLFFHKKFARRSDLFKLACLGNIITYLLITAIYVQVNTRPPPFDRWAEHELQYALAAQFSYAADHQHFCNNIDGLIEHEDYQVREGVVIRILYADQHNLKLIAYHEKGSKGFIWSSVTEKTEEITKDEAAGIVAHAAQQTADSGDRNGADLAADINWDMRIAPRIRHGIIDESSPEVNFLILALKDERKHVRKLAARFLGDIQADRARVPLKNLIASDPAMDARKAAIEALMGMQNASGIDQLVGILADRGVNRDSRVQVCRALGDSKDPRAVDPLIGELDASDKQLRSAAALALGKIGDRRAVEPLVEILNSPRRDNRQSAAAALGMLKDPKAIDPLIAALKNGDPSVKKSAASALKEMPDPRSVEPLIAALADPSGAVRYQAGFALGKICRFYGFESLEAAAASKNWGVRKMAVLALGETENAKAAETIVGALGDEQVEVRKCAASACGKLEDPRAVDPLIAALDDVYASVREEAASALGKIGDARAVEPLVRHLQQEKYPIVKSFMKNALAEITGERDGKNFDPEEWLNWWQHNKQNYLSEES
jgi:HEAT repeat protein